MDARAQSPECGCASVVHGSKVDAVVPECPHRMLVDGAIDWPSLAGMPQVKQCACQYQQRD